MVLYFYQINAALLSITDFFQNIKKLLSSNIWSVVCKSHYAIMLIDKNCLIYITNEGFKKYIYLLTFTTSLAKLFFHTTLKEQNVQAAFFH